jgi:ectoine hydroxylase-related dioxygenase (phytanoyl-CoA dioxygenase family)
MQTLADAGFEVLPALLDAADLAAIAARLAGRGRVGERDLLDEAWCAELARRLHAHARVARALPCTHVAVQCTSFEKSVDRNWLVPVHQDLAIPVAARVDHPALGGWSNKGGTWFVQPPAEVLESLVALRLHVDDCGVDDGPLNVVAGSHRQGRIDDARAIALRDELGTVACPAPRGGVMLMRPLLLHASSKATGASRRRVLHFLFGPRRLPFGLAWAHTLGVTRS